MPWQIGAKDQPYAAPRQQFSTPTVKNDAEIELQPGLRAKEQPGPEKRNPSLLWGKEQPPAFTNNYARDEARAVFGNLSLQLPYLDGLDTAYGTCGKTLESIASNSVQFPDDKLAATARSLAALVQEKRELLAEQKTRLYEANMLDADTAKLIREQDNRVRFLCTDVVEKLVSDPQIGDKEYEPGTSYLEHIRRTLEDVYEKCKPALDGQIRKNRQAMLENPQERSKKKGKLRRFFVRLRAVAQPGAALNSYSIARFRHK